MAPDEHIDHANDLALLSHKLQGMCSKMVDLKAAGDKIGLEINADKTKLMKVMTTLSRGVTTINLSVLEEGPWGRM